MHFSLIGMSNIGKTYWARRIAAERGWNYIGCDLLIEKKLGLGSDQAGLRNVAAWMGQPGDARYEEHSLRYLAGEQEVMRDILTALPQAQVPQVIDCTGSVVYIDGKILEDLKERTRVIYLQASHAHRDDLYRRYLANPKPVIWQTAYAPTPNEDPVQTRMRCYPALLHRREAMYADVAGLPVIFERHRDRNASVDQVLGSEPDA